MQENRIERKIWDTIEHKSLLNKILTQKNINLKGLPESLKTLFVSLLYDRSGHSLMVILPTIEKAEFLADECTALVNGDCVIFYPGGEEDADTPFIINPRRAGLQMQAFRALISCKAKLFITSASGIIRRFPNIKTMKKQWVKLVKGSNHDLIGLVETLISFGYNRESMVEKPGEISLRGGILDIFPYTGEEPHRIEFFGDQIDSIRTFDIVTQRSKESRGFLQLIPAPVAWDDRSSSLFSYFQDDLIVFLEDRELILAEAEKYCKRNAENSYTTDELKQLFDEHNTISYFSFAGPKDSINFGGKELRSIGRSTLEIRENLASLCNTHKDVFVLCDRKDQKDRIFDFLGLDENPIPGLSLDVVPLQKGFLLSESGLAVYTVGDLFGRYIRKSTRRFHQGVPIRELSSLTRGDFVVHIDYGIGNYQGLEKIFINGTERECLSLLYRDGDKLYVPIGKMERIQRYAGKGGAEPCLSRLGGDAWEKVKARTKRSIKNIARELVSIYSARQADPGFSFSVDASWQKELEATFIYEETPDQAKAILDVKMDMEQSRPMDRLVCGDVGYGKTEVAVRAAFKAVNDGKQVAVLVPTTILAQQHFRTFQDRLSRYPVNLEVLSRFRSRKEQKEIIRRINQGEVDIVIGTHRLLSKDVIFKDIGLLVIDEEQRFGVRHKERLKTFRKTVDVLALSATPIPRTLHLSLTGIRDMSLITTAPRDRLSIITEVAPFSEDIVATAIDQELSRGGQVFFVHNRIDSIYAVARMVRRIVPGIKLAVVHGRMKTDDIERAMLEFMDRKYDCLVATMIIESGLDIPNVNTLIVHRADRLGMAQLYQLRGRVGRSNTRAYAFLLTPPFHHLTREAIKRLRTIEEFTELGSGIQIALRDLEIRGAGNLLGVDQSGYMDAVGFDLYTKLVNEAVEEMKAEEKGQEYETTEEDRCQIEVDWPAYIPESYVGDESLRVDLYRRLSRVHSWKEIDEFAIELLDRFGPLPKATEDLLEVMGVRILGQARGLRRIILNEKILTATFDASWASRFSTPELFSKHLGLIINSSSEPVKFLQKEEFSVRISIPEEDPLPFTKKLLQSWG